MKGFIFICSLLISFSLSAQDKISSWDVSLSTDSLLIGNQLKVTFTLKNARGNNFSPPSFKGLGRVMGPNQSSSMSIVNGDMTQEKSYTFYLEPVEPGAYYIDPAAIEINGEIMETEPIEVFVFPNPDGIIQDHKDRPLEWNQLPWEPPAKKKEGKKKKKIYKI